MKHKTIQTKKVYEEKLNEELCNFNPNSFNNSDAHETGRTRETMESTANLSQTNYTNSVSNKDTIFGVTSKAKNFINNNHNNNNSNNTGNGNLNKSSSREREKGKKSSRKSSKNSFRESPSNLDPLPTVQSPLISLVDSLKEKLEFYENEVKSLIDEKIQMQMTINNLQMQQMRKSTNNSRNSGRSKDNTVNNINKSALLSDNNKILRISHESVFELQNNSRIEDKSAGSGNVNNLLNNGVTNTNNGKNKLLGVDYIITNNNHNKSFNDVHSRKNSNAISIGNNNNINNALSSFDKESLLNNHQDNLSRQKKLLETNNSILEDTINMQNIKDFEEKFSLGLNSENENDQLVFLRLQYENQKKKEYDFEKSKNEARNALLELEKQKLFMLSEINNLRDELQSLMEVQQHIMQFRDESALENTQNLIRNSNLNVNNNNIQNSSQQIYAIEAENVKNSKNKSFDNKYEKSNIYLPTCETYKKADMTNDDLAFQNLSSNRIRFTNNCNNLINLNNSNSLITYDKSDLNRCFIQELNNEKTISANAENNTKISKENNTNNNILNVSDIEASLTPNKSLIFSLGNNKLNNNNQSESQNQNFINISNSNIQRSILKNKNSERDLEQQQISYSNINHENLLSTGKKPKNSNRLIEFDSNMMSPANKNNSIQENFNFQNINNNNNNISMTNINCPPNNNNNNSINNNNNGNIGLPNIENFFIIKDKVFLVDGDKNVWHLKKCKRFDKIQKEFLKENNLSDEYLISHASANNLNNENQQGEPGNNCSLVNVRNQIFNNFLDFYQGHENQINANLRENNQSNNLISENDLKSQNHVESNAECKSSRTAGENKILNSSNISKQINSSYNNILSENLNNNNNNNNGNNTNKLNIDDNDNDPNNYLKVTNDSEKIHGNNSGAKTNQNLNRSQTIIESECASIHDENQKALIDQSNLIQNEQSNFKNNYEENFENPDNTITSMDLVSDYSRKLIRVESNNDNSQIIRNIEDAKEERNDHQVFEMMDKVEENAEQDRNAKGNRDADKDTTYNLSDDSS